MCVSCGSSHDELLREVGGGAVVRVPLSWLRELTPLSAQAEDRSAVAELASELDSLGLVVEKTDWVGEGLSDVVLARVLEIAPIEGADRIRRVVVDRGGGETTEVVCGAWNFEVGDVVVLAPVGSVLPGDFRIERRKMKGVVSNGMLCSGRELRLSEDHEGILVLARPRAGADGAGADGDGFRLGTPLSEHLGTSLDVVFDLAIEPNRPDCLSMIGIARDLAAHYGLPLNMPEPQIPESDPPATDLATVEIEAPELCQRLLGRVLTGIRPAQSPLEVQRRLVLAGMRPINHVVDASNYVMLELGQPNHPYDLDLLGGAGLRVRAAHAGETIVTLDGETRILGGREPRGDDAETALDGLICSANDLPVGIAGVMGGRSSEIGEGTERVLLEVARFSAVAVGRTSRHIGLRTEASIRFERGVDAEGMERSADRFCELVVKAAVVAGLEPPVVARGLVDANPRPFRRTTVSYRPARSNTLLGLSLSGDQVMELLRPIGYESGGEPQGDGALSLTVPPWRPDVTREVDVIEDVARTYGYRRIPRTERRSPYVGKLDDVQLLRRRVRRVLTGLGAHEAWTASIVDPAEQQLAGVASSLIRLANPMVAEESVMRGGMLAGLLKAIRHNAGHRNPWVRLFEIGDVFALTDGSGVVVGPEEGERVALVLARQDDDAGSAMNAWRVVADALGIEGVEVDQAADSTDGLAGLHHARSGLLVVAGPESLAVVPHDPGELAPGTIVGAVGEIDPDVLAAFGVPHARVGWLELHLARLVVAPRRAQLARPVSRYPSSDIDLAFSVDESVPAGHIGTVIRTAAGELCEALELFDVYRGAGLADGRRSLAFRLRLCAADRTLTDAEVAEVRQRCVESVEAALPATLR
jgi:phenylalanyl-tRNA synthetase beta chain